MKILKLFIFFLLFVFGSACKPKQAVPHTDQIDYRIQDTVMAYGPNTMVRNVKQGKNGTILFAASKAGIFRYDGKLFTKLTSKIGTRRYWDVLEDRKGELWFSSTDSGIYHYNGKSFEHLTTREGLADNGAGAIYESRSGAIWFATGKGASRLYSGKFINFTTKDGLTDNRINAIMEDKTGKFWFGTRGYLSTYDGKTFTTVVNHEGKVFYNVWSIIEDRKGNIWFGGSIIKSKKGKELSTEDGLWRYDGKTFIKVSERGASFIIQDKKGNIWTTGSLNPPNGNIWVLSRYESKSLYNKNPEISDIFTMKGLGMLCGILEDTNGNIWFGGLGTASGVYRYDGHSVTDFRREDVHK